MNMARTVPVSKLTLWLTFIALALLLAACGADPDTPTVAASTPVATAPSSAVSAERITANGVLRPLRQMALSLGVSGYVESLPVEVGQQVNAGQPIAALDDAALQQAVAAAQLELAQSQAQLARLQARATPVAEQVLAATVAVTNAQTALSQARVQAGQLSNQETISRSPLEQAEDALADAQDGYNQLLDNPHTRDWAPYSPAADALAVAQDHYDVTLARYNLETSTQRSAANAALTAAEAQLAQARWALYQTQHPVTPEELTLAELQVERAELALEVAQANLEQARLVAPFDGIVSAVLLGVGEWAAPGAVVVELLDVSRWRVETNNVGELRIAHVQEGQEAVVRVNAFQGQPLSGRVVTISPVAVVQQGDTTYTLLIELEPTDLNLRPGMTAQVEISPSE